MGHDTADENGPEMNTAATNRVDDQVNLSPVDASIVASANWWFDISWYGLLIAGGITALAAAATVIFLFVQFRSGSIKERYTDWRTTVLENETAVAKAELGKSNERIAELNNDTVRLSARLAWRILSPIQQGRITQWAIKYGPQKFTTVTYRDDLEASNLGALIRQSLEVAGWSWGQSTPLDWLDAGVSVEIANAGVSNLGRAATELVAALNAEQVITKQVHTDKYNPYPDTIFVIVGKKPPTAEDFEAGQRTK